MALRRWTPGCPCCFEFAMEWGPSDAQFLHDYWNGTTDIYQDLSKLNGLRMVMNGFACGRFPGVGDADWATVTIPSTDWPQLKEWIEAGGVMFCEMDTFIAWTNAPQINDLRSHYNDLFAYLDTDLFIEAIPYRDINLGCNLAHQSIINTAINAPVLENVDQIHHALVYEGITGGTWLAKYVSEDPETEGILVACAAVGDGYVFLTADTNISIACGSYWDEEQTTNSNYQFFANIFEKDVLL